MLKIISEEVKDHESVDKAQVRKRLGKKGITVEKRQLTEDETKSEDEDHVFMPVYPKWTIE